MDKYIVLLWITIGISVLFVVALALMSFFAFKYNKEKKYAKMLLKSMSDLEKSVEASENHARLMSKALDDIQSEAATAKSEKYTLSEKLKDLTNQLEEDKGKIKSLFEEIALKDEKLKNVVPMEEHKKLVEELTASEKKSSNVDTLISKVEELTEKTTPIIKKEVVKIKKYSLEELQAMYKHELMTLAQNLKLTGWTRFSKEKLASFIYKNLPKEQKKVLRKKKELR